jgi:hypothetical protein
LAPVPVISSFTASVLLAVAGIAASYLDPARRLAQTVRARPILVPLAWYGIGILLGPGLGLLDDRVWEAAMPALLLAAAWVAARAGSLAVSPEQLSGRRAAVALADAVAAWLLPAAALYAAARYLPATLAPMWEPRWPVLVALAAAMTLASGANRRLATLVALCALLVALVAALPDTRILRLPRYAAWAVSGLVGVGFTAVLWGWIGRRATPPLRGTVVGLAVGTGIGLAAGVSPLIVCAIAAAVLAGRSIRSMSGAWESLARSEAAAAAMVWVAAGTQLAGSPAPLAIAVLALSLWPLVRRLVARAPNEPDRTLGLVVLLSYVWTTNRGDAAPLVTVVALGLLVTGMLTSHRRAGSAPLTSGLAPIEVSA